MFVAIPWSIAVRSSLPAILLATVFALGSPVAGAQEEQNANSNSTPANSQSADKAKPASEPLFREYKGVTLGMSADEARQKLGDSKEKGKKQEFFVFSDKESAQVYYDQDQKVRAISINYVGQDSGAPAPAAILGMEIEAKANGSLHKLVRYPEAGYWVSYSRTAGDAPLITVTMQRMRAVKR